MDVGSDPGPAGRRHSAGPDAADMPAKKKRKQRPSYSCQECRRLKMKCDRNVPCSNCVRRHRPEHCHGANENGSSGISASARDHVSDTSETQDVGPRPESQHDTIVTDFGFPDEAPQSLAPPQYDHHDQDVSGRLQVQDLGLPHAVEPPSAPGGDPNSLPAVPLQFPTVNRASFSEAGSGRRHTPAIDNDDAGGSYGTLLCSDGGRSKYLGPTAGSEWLKDSETREMSATPAATREPSPDPSQVPGGSVGKHTGSPATPIGFPFSSAPARISTRDLLAKLPSREEAWALAEAYFRYCAWHYDVAPKPSFTKTFDRVYNLREGQAVSPAINPQEIALVYMVMAQGTLYNIEMPFRDPSAEGFLHLAQSALVKGEFLATSTVAGLQTLYLMAHYHLESDKGRRGDMAWTLWGLVMRLIQAMGMHRDGTRWKLPDNVVEERRKVFWECNSADVFQAHCFSRPYAINPDHCDTAFPTETSIPEQSYRMLRFKLSLLSAETLNIAMKVRRPQYSVIMDLDTRLSQFEQNVPFELRCRAALLSMPSRYLDRERAIEDSPEPSKILVASSFQQMNLTVNISETIINLHRPYYAKALHEELEDPVLSKYAPSFLTVIERCSIIISVVADIHARFPAVSARQWSIWYHVYNSALCLGTHVVRNPRSPLAPVIVGQLETSVHLFNSLIQHGANTPRYHRNLRGLMQLSTLASSKIASSSSNGNSHQDTEVQAQLDAREVAGEDVELIGWRTRLVERAGQDRRTITTISAATPGNTESSTPPSRHQIPEVRSPHRLSGFMTDLANPDSAMTGDVLQDFWDPLLLEDLFMGSSDTVGNGMDNGVQT